MVALNFPNSPTNGQIYENYQYDGTEGVWKRLPSGLNTNAPSPLTGETLVYDGSQWVNSNAPSHNYIINGAFDIWQRGDNGTGSNTYVSADRWLSFSSAAINKSTDVPEPSFEYSADVSAQGNSNFEGIATRLESSHCTLLASKTVTLSMYVKANNETINNGGKIEVQTTNSKDNFLSSARSIEIVEFLSDLGATADSWTRVHITGPLTGDAANGIQINILPVAGTASATATLKVAGVQLEAGSVATPFKRNANSIAGEEDACFRYYQRIGGQQNNHLLGSGQFQFTDEARIPLQFIRPMRATPTVSAPTVTNGYIVQSAGTNTSNTDLDFSTINSYSCQVNFAGGGFTTGNACNLLTNSVDSFVELNAEL